MKTTTKKQASRKAAGNWTVSSKTSTFMDVDKRTKRTATIHVLKFKGKVVHEISGPRGLSILSKQARQYNRARYEPILTDIKVACDLPNEAARIKFIRKQGHLPDTTPPLTD